MFKPLLKSQVLTWRPDYLILTGDLTSNGVHSLSEVNQLVSVLDYLSEDVKIVMCLGNHDIGLSPRYFEGMLKDNVHVLENETWADPETNLTFWGGALSVAYNLPVLAERWDYMTTSYEHEQSYFAQIPDDVDVIVSHSPPSGKLAKMYNGVDIGSRFLRKELTSDRMSPAFVASSHCHENGSQSEVINGITCYNVALTSTLIEI